MVTFSKKQKKAIAKHISLALDTAFSGRGCRQKLAALAGVTPAALSQWKNGSKTPTLEHLFLLSKALGVPVHTLCGITDTSGIHSGDPVFNSVMALSLIGGMLDKPGRMTPAAKRKLDRIGKTLEKLEKTGRNTN
jgi:transcriptional regulator with XRE-family HTH domain